MTAITPPVAGLVPDECKCLSHDIGDCMRTHITALAVITALTVGTVALVMPEHPSHAERPNGGRPTHEVDTHLPTTPLEIGEITVQLIVDYARAVTAANIVAYVQSVEAEQARVAEQERIAADAATTAQAAPTMAPSSGATGACGGATNGADQFIMRESGGNPNAYNPSGAWGCYQIMPGTWAGAGCNELGAYGSADTAIQAQCASRLPMSAWAL